MESTRLPIMTLDTLRGVEADAAAAESAAAFSAAARAASSDPPHPLARVAAAAKTTESRRVKCDMTPSLGRTTRGGHSLGHRFEDRQGGPSSRWCPDTLRPAGGFRRRAVKRVHLTR